MIMLCLCYLNYSCKKIDKSQILIEGDGFGKKIKKVYLIEAGKWKVLLDSADCIDGRFKLKYRPPVSFEPFKASLKYVDNDFKRNNFAVRSEIEIKKDGKNHSNDSFMLDYGVTNLTYFNKVDGSIQVNIKGGRESDLFQRYDYQNFGYIPKARSEAREQRLKEVVNLIKGNPYSFYLLSCILEYRQNYSKDELKEILNYFDEEVQKSRVGNRMKEYISNSLNVGENTRPLSLMSDLGIRKENINKTADLNMLIFWASWCGPCRMEIPQLKKLNELVKDQGFYMASISIDKNKKDWNTALIQEQLNWDQFIISENELDKIEAQYAFTAIPIVIFTNRNGKEIARFRGFSLDHLDSYKKLIEANLPKVKL